MFFCRYSAFGLNFVPTLACLSLPLDPFLRLHIMYRMSRNSVLKDASSDWTVATKA